MRAVFIVVLGLIITTVIVSLFLKPQLKPSQCKQIREVCDSDSNKCCNTLTCSSLGRCCSNDVCSSKEDCCDSKNCKNSKCCTDLGGKCTTIADCCQPLNCLNGKCESEVALESMPAFFLFSPNAKCIGVSSDGVIKEISDECVWTNGTVPSFWWSWIKDTGELIYNEGNRTSYVAVGKGNASLTEDVSGGLIFTSTMRIFTNDYKSSIAVDQNGVLVWGSSPDQFTISVPSNCSTTQCSLNTDCCPPFNNCHQGKCTTCFGTPITCPTDQYTDCVDQKWSCVSRCQEDPPQCANDELPQCSYNPSTQVYEFECVSQCKGKPKLICTDGTLSTCEKGHDGEWNWSCNNVPCAPSSHFDGSCGSGCVQKGEVWDCGDKGCYLPYWDCESSTYKCSPICCDEQTKCSSSQVPQCVNNQWSCSTSTNPQSLCDLMPKPGCSDAVCLNFQGCESDGNVLGWQWVCPSSATRCQLLQINNLQEIEASIESTGSTIQIVVDSSETPVHPTTRLDKCRGNDSTKRFGVDIENKINNPKGFLSTVTSGGKIMNVFTPFGDPTKGDSDVVYSTWGDDRYCISSNPCKPYGSYSSLTLPPTISPYGGIVSPPSSEELLGVGSCKCLDGHAGTTCEYDNKVCNNGKVVTPTSGSAEYECVCNEGYLEPHCKYTRGDCSNNGVPVEDSSPKGYSCSCDFPGDSVGMNYAMSTSDLYEGGFYAGNQTLPFCTYIGGGDGSGPKDPVLRKEVSKCLPEDNCCGTQLLNDKDVCFGYIFQDGVADSNGNITQYESLNRVSGKANNGKCLFNYKFPMGDTCQFTDDDCGGPYNVVYDVDPQGHVHCNQSYPEVGFNFLGSSLSLNSGKTNLVCNKGFIPTDLTPVGKRTPFKVSSSTYPWITSNNTLYCSNNVCLLNTKDKTLEFQCS